MRFVDPPLITTALRASARRTRSTATVRSGPHAVNTAISGSSASTMSPTRRLASIRTPVPTGKDNNTRRPGVTTKSESGSSAIRWASTATPSSAGGSAGSASPRSILSRQPMMLAPVRSSVVA